MLVMVTFWMSVLTWAGVKPSITCRTNDLHDIDRIACDAITFRLSDKNPFYII